MPPAHLQAQLLLQRALEVAQMPQNPLPLLQPLLQGGLPEVPRPKALYAELPLALEQPEMKGMQTRELQGQLGVVPAKKA